jgi:NitT/TauT family transport system substrate-binding protein
MVDNKPPFAIVARKSRGITEPKQLEGKKLGGATTGATFPQWPLFAKLNEIDVAKVMVETIGVPVRAPMLAAGQLDAALGYSFRVYVDLKDRGVPVDDIADACPIWAVALRQCHHRIPSSRPKLEPVKASAWLAVGLKDSVRNLAAAVDLRCADDIGKKEVESRTAAHGDHDAHPDA